MFNINEMVKSAFHRFGFELRRLPGAIAPGKAGLGVDPFHDIRRFLGPVSGIMVFDVGANVGQTIRRARVYLDHPVIHAFEPTPDIFRQLSATTANVPGLTLNNFALGSRTGEARFIMNSELVYNSLLEAGPESYGSITRTITIPVRTLDEYCLERQVEKIDVLKIDTQGFELEVLRGAESMLRQRRIGIALMEITFSQMYKGLPGPDQIYRYMVERGYSLVSFYDLHYQNNRLGWCDAMFVYRGQNE